jgi:hypothetical protein
MHYTENCKIGIHNLMLTAHPDVRVMGNSAIKHISQDEDSWE